MGNTEQIKRVSFLLLICFAAHNLVTVSANPTADMGLAVYKRGHEKNNNEQEAKAFLSAYNQQLERLTNIAVLADWEYNTNLTEENAEKSIAAGLAVTEFNAAAFEVASQFDTTNFTSDTTRQLSKVGKKSLSDEEMKNLSSIISQMGQIYGEGKVCRDKKLPLDEECLSLEPDLTKLMAESRNATELLWAWQGWRTNVARQIKPLYLQRYKIVVRIVIHFLSQPNRDGSNDGFHEAIGELMSMCVSTPKHLYTIGLLDNLLQDNETTINYLFQQSLSTLSALPFHYLNDLWRWKAFRGDFPNRISWNDEFWNLAEEIVGVHAPVERGLEDLDCPAIFHVAQDYDMIRYFTRTILQFQFAESLCRTAGHEGPLNECDFYGSTEAGQKLATSALTMWKAPTYSFKQWACHGRWEARQKIMKLIIKPQIVMLIGQCYKWVLLNHGQMQMNARAIREYFAPLEKWLRETNKANGDTPGWSLKRVKSQGRSSI